MKICKEIQIWLKSDKISDTFHADFGTIFIVVGDIKLTEML